MQCGADMGLGTAIMRRHSMGEGTLKDASSAVGEFCGGFP